MSVDDVQSSPHEDEIEMLVAAAAEIAQLRTAVEHRTVIGQAQGILMERLMIDAETAFAYLRRVSMTSNRKLVDIADEVTRTRELPDLT